MLETGQGAESEKPATVGKTALAQQRHTLPAGTHELQWHPDPSLAARTYILRLSAAPTIGIGRTASASAVARILGVDAGFGVPSAKPGDTVTLVVRTDAKRLTLQMLRSGPETLPTYANDVINGVPSAGRRTSTGARTPSTPRRSTFRSATTGRPASTPCS